MTTKARDWTLEESIPNEVAHGKRLVEAVIARLEGGHWLPHDIFGVHLALEEALMNAMKHGNDFAPEKRVRFLCRIQGDTLHLEIADDGPGFDPADVPDCTEEENLDKPSGRGLTLMRSFMDSVRHADGGTRVVMEKRKA